MITPLSLALLAKTYGGDLMGGDAEISRLVIDSRKASHGDLFAALTGQHVDGHDYLAQAAQSGASAALVQRPVDVDLVQWVVPDVVQAMGWVAGESRNQFRGTLFGVTGSNGKTTVKEMLAAICNRRGECLSTRGNLNNHLGVPMMLSELQSQHRYAVIEMGASAIGEIDYLASMAKPDVALVTMVGHAHLEGFGSRGGIVRGKGEIYDHIPATGRAVINLDSYGHEEFLRRTRVQQLTFSTRVNSGADVLATDIKNHSQGSTWRLVSPLGEIEIQQSHLGMTNVYNALAAAASALAAGLGLEDIREGLAAGQRVEGRLFPRAGREGSLILDDAYNANPDSVAAAIDVLAGRQGARWLVLGDMAELGEGAAEMHRQVGELARRQAVDGLIAVGELAAHAAEAFGSGGQVVASTDEATRWLLPRLSADTSVLVKGSRSARMERVVQGLVAEEKN